MLPSHNLAAYASDRNVIIVSVPECVPSAILDLHKSRATSLHLIEHESEPHVFSSSSGGSIAVASCIRQSAWQLTASYQAHDAPCIALFAISMGDSITVFTAAADSFKVFEYRSGKFRLTTQAPFTPNPDRTEFLPECIAAHSLSKTTLVALGGTDNRIQLHRYTESEKSLKFLTYLHGHRDWIRDLAFTTNPENMLLASASTDNTVRVWQITPAMVTQPETATPSIELPAPEDIALTPIAQLSEHTSVVHTVAFDSIADHLLTASNDCTVAVWRTKPAPPTCVARFGLMGGQSAHALGFFGAHFTTDSAEHILAHNFSGALHRWVMQSDETYEYRAHPGPRGHFDVVTQVLWSPDGNFLMSCSADKTARVYAEVDGVFAEIARPQVHGHSIFAIAFCDRTGLKYVSGAEERMLRMFEAPGSFALRASEGNFANVNATGALMPELGLSNKPVFDDVQTGSGEANNDEAIVSMFGADRGRSNVPLEEDLNQSLLWPETAKLYGHGNEISYVAVDVANGVMASACRAQASKDAVIILWDVESGIERGRLAAHDLTVNQMVFTDNGKMLASVSKDRSVAIFGRDEGQFDFSLQLHKKAAHTRLIYCCTWVWDEMLLATGGRDKCIKLFSVDKRNEDGEVLKRKFESAVTALDCMKLKNGCRILAGGFESGLIRVLRVEKGGDGYTLREDMNYGNVMKCGSRVTSLHWRPNELGNESDSVKAHLAVGSEDHSVRIYELEIEEDG